MHHVKLGRFTGEATPKGSYRHNAAHAAVTGIEGDYDAGEMTVDQAVAALARAGIAALVYTTPSHLQPGKGHRWRVFCPLSAEGMGRVVAVARALTEWEAAVILVHHDSKDGNQGLPRGHSLLNGALDLSIHRTKGQDATVRGRLTKNRNGPVDSDLAFQIRSIPIGEDEDGDSVTAALCDPVYPAAGRSEPGLTPAERAAVRLVAEMAGETGGVSREDWIVAAISPDEMQITTAETDDNRRRAVRRILGQLVDRGQIEISDGRIRLNQISDDREFDDLDDNGDRAE